VAQRLGKSVVIGTTGFDAEQRALIEQAAKEIPIVLAPNMAVGVNVVFRLLEGAAALLGEGYDVEVIEAHHRNKVDAPSGTALEMGRILARVLGLDLEREAVYGRQGEVGVRPSRQIGFSTDPRRGVSWGTTPCSLPVPVSASRSPTVRRAACPMPWGPCVRRVSCRAPARSLRHARRAGLALKGAAIAAGRFSR